MITDSKIIEIFCLLDDFSKEYNTLVEKNSLLEPIKRKTRKKNRRMSDGEVMTILVLFHLKSYRSLKHFYINHVCKHMRDEFPDCVSYHYKREQQHKVFVGLAQKS